MCEKCHDKKWVVVWVKDSYGNDQQLRMPCPVCQAAQQSVQSDTPKRCGCGYTFQSHIPNCLQCGAVNPAYR